MSKTSLFTSIAALVTVAAGAAATAQSRPGAAGGTVTYWMSAETTSGLAAMSQSGRPTMASALSGRMSSPSYVRNLTLQLGSPRRAAGAPAAEHLPPSALGAGPSLPLLSPERAPVQPQNHTAPTYPQGQPQGRILIYWGCGERARPGQPFEIDLARLRPGQMPPAMAQMAIQAMNPPSAATSTTYGEWPNQRSQERVPANGSLVGAHAIRGNYTPEINFSLAANNDFLAPIAITRNSPAPSRAVPVAWQSVPGARAFFMMATGAAQDGTIVMWSSSEVQFSQMGVLDYLSDGEIARLLQQRVLLPAATTQCTVPAEVAGRVQAASLMLTGFGGEANFSTPRPAGAARSWRPDWNVKLRTRTAYMGMLGQDMEAMMRGGEARDREQQRPEQPQRRRSLRDRILGL